MLLYTFIALKRILFAKQQPHQLYAYFDSNFQPIGVHKKKSFAFFSG